MFPLAKLLICIATNDSTTKKTLRKVKPLLEQIRDAEYVKRTMIGDLGVKVNERIVLKSSKKQEQDDEYECEICSENLYVSYVSLKILAFLPFFYFSFILHYNYRNKHLLPEPTRVLCYNFELWGVIKPNFSLPCVPIAWT